MTLPKGLSGKIAGVPYCSEAAIAAAAGQTGAAELADSSCSSASQIGTTTTRSRQRQQPDRGRRQGVPRRPLQGRAALDGRRHPGGRRPIRPRHRRDQGRAQRQSRNGADHGELRRDPEHPRRGQARHPGDRRRPGPQRVHAQPDQLQIQPGDGLDQGRWLESGQPGRVQHLPVHDAVRDRPTATRSRSSRSSGVKVLGGKKGTKRRGHPRIQATLTQKAERSQHRLHGGDTAEDDAAGQLAFQNHLHEGAAGGPAVPGGGPVRNRHGDLAVAERQPVRPGLPGVVQRQAAEPGRRPARSGERPAPRRDHLGEGRDEDHVPERSRMRRSPSSSSRWTAAPRA